MPKVGKRKYPYTASGVEAAEAAAARSGMPMKMAEPMPKMPNYAPPKSAKKSPPKRGKKVSK